MTEVKERSSLLHEHKMVSLLASQQVSALEIFKTISGPETGWSKPFILNESFTIYFCAEASSHNLLLAGSELGMPGTIGNEIMLVVDECDMLPLFLEYMGPSIPQVTHLECYVQSVARLRSVSQLRKPSVQLLEDFCKAFDSSSNRTSSTLLTYARFIVLHDTICFFLGSSNRFLSPASAEYIHTTLSAGEICQIYDPGGVAIEGWVNWHLDN